MRFFFFFFFMDHIKDCKKVDADIVIQNENFENVFDDDENFF